MYCNNFNSSELLSNPDEVVKKLVHCVKEWNVTKKKGAIISASQQFEI